MTIRKKAIIAIVLVFACLIAIMILTSRFFFLRNLAEAEEIDVRHNVEQVRNYLAFALSDLETITSNWSSWDDTYTFVDNVNNEYIETNLGDQSFIMQDLNMMLFLDSSGQVVFDKAFDLNNREETQVPQSLYSYLYDGDLPLNHLAVQSAVSGILLLPEQPPLLIVSRPILTSDDKGPIKGAVVFGRYIDTKKINALCELFSLSLTPYRVDDTELPSDIEEIYHSLLQEGTVPAQPLDDKNIAGYSLIRDIYGNPALILKIEMPRDVYQQGQQTITYLMLAIALVGTIFGTIAASLMITQGVSRLSKLAKNVESIGASGDTSAMIPVKGGDEISILEKSVNSMQNKLRLSEESLNKSNEHFKALIENSFDNIVVLNADASISYASPSIKNSLGYEPKEIIGKKAFSFVHPDNILMVMDMFTKGIETSIDTQSLEFVIRHKDGSWRNIEAMGTNLLDNPVVRGIAVNFHDITERKQTEKALQELYNEEAELRQKMETEIQKRMEFTRALVHELKTPLTPVLASSDILITELNQGPLLDLAKNINRGALRLESRIDELLDLARSEIGMLRLSLTQVELSQLIREVVDEMTPAASKQGLSLDLDLPTTISPVRGDESRLRQIMLNLLDNACKFTSEGGRITVRVREDNEFLIIEVQDTGPGLAEEEQQSVFQLYYRGAWDRQQLSGLGLGLALCKTLVELHGGQIWVQSSIGKGSIFGFSVPLQTTVNQAEKPETREENEGLSY